MTLTQGILAHALALGFDIAGMIPIGPPRHGAAFTGWLAAGYHGEMSYLAARAAERTNPGVFAPGARSVIVVAANYNPRLTIRRVGCTGTGSHRPLCLGAGLPRRDQAETLRDRRVHPGADRAGGSGQGLRGHCAGAGTRLRGAGGAGLHRPQLLSDHAGVGVVDGAGGIVGAGGTGSWKLEAGSWECVQRQG